MFGSATITLGIGPHFYFIMLQGVLTQWHESESESDARDNSPRRSAFNVRTHDCKDFMTSDK